MQHSETWNRSTGPWVISAVPERANDQRTCKSQDGLFFCRLIDSTTAGTAQYMLSSGVVTMRYILTIFSILAQISVAQADGATCCDYFPPVPDFSIPHVGGTGSTYIAGWTGAGGNTLFFGLTTPIFTVPVAGTLTLSYVYVSDQYGDISYFNPLFTFDGSQPYFSLGSAGCNYFSDPSCSVTLPDPITVQFNLPAFSQITFASGMLEIDAVPEPSTWAMILLGLCGLGLLLHRQRSEA
jgi:hypothetical protein